MVYLNGTAERQNVDRAALRTRPKSKSPEGALAPRVDVFESDAEVLVVADLPGVTSDQLEVRFDDGELVIDARRTIASELGTALARERRTAERYFRTFALPDGVDVERIEAKLVGGVLSVHLPKQASKRSHRIEVKSG